MISYIDLINGFWDKDIEYGFSPVATKMYFALLDTCNRLGWKNPFKLTNSRLSHVVKCSENSIINSRFSLAKANLISFKKGYKSKCCIYYIKGNKTTYNKGLFRDDLDKPFSNTCANSSEVLIDVRDHHLDKHCDIHKTKLNKTRGEKTLDALGEKIEKNIPIHQIVYLYNHICGEYLRQIDSINGIRMKNLKNRWNEYPNLGTWETIFHKVVDSDYLSGRTKQWKATFDWIIKNQNNIVKVLDGNYDNFNNKNNVWEDLSEYDDEDIQYDNESYI